MFEALESRQLFSVALYAATPTAEPVTEPAPIVVDADATAAKPKPKPQPKPETYLVVTMSDCLISG